MPCEVSMTDINTTLNERGARYGNYSDVAGVTQALMSIVESGANYEHLNAEQKTSLFMICNKIARAVNGDPQYFDNWRDIAGYATLAEKACEVVETPKVISGTEKKSKPKCNCAHWKNSSFFHGETHTCGDCGGEVMI